MSATATDEGANVPELDCQLAIPPTTRRIRRTSDADASAATRSPCRREGIRAATDPVVMGARLYQQFSVNLGDPLYRRMSSARQPAPYSIAAAGTRSFGAWMSEVVM